MCLWDCFERVRAFFFRWVCSDWQVVLSRRRDLKLIVTSATMNAEKAWMLFVGRYKAYADKCVVLVVLWQRANLYHPWPYIPR